MSLVVDASVVVAALLDRGNAGAWAEAQLLRGVLFAPHLLLVEAASALRRAALQGDVSEDVAVLAHEDLLDLDVELLSYSPFADRVWRLRGSVSTYDAWYVAVAEELQVPLATLDHRLARAPGPRCSFVLP